MTINTRQNHISSNEETGKKSVGTDMSNVRPAIVIAGTQSGVGKTSVSLGLIRLLSRRGFRVQTFKIGPDYLDPTYLALASGRPCCNLDTWMMGRQYARRLFSRGTRDADIAVIEGVMGMYDGCRTETSESSTADVAACLNVPMLLVCDAHGTARSLAATVKGFAEFEEDPKVAGVIANRCGSARHGDMLAAALASVNQPPLLGAVPRDEFPSLPSRHLGLVAADHESTMMKTIDKLADVCERCVNTELMLEIARNAAPAPEPATGSPSLKPKEKVRIGVAHDRAFHFYYRDNMEALEDRGCELKYFSPLTDSALPEDIQALYIGGGYPEEHADDLAGNQAMLESVRQFCHSGRPVYGECGGLMYLSRGIEKLDGDKCFLVGVIPVFTRMLPRLRALGYAEVKLEQNSFWGSAGSTLRGHEFHYSEVISDLPAEADWRKAYTVSSPRRGETGKAGFMKGNILASYIHLHFASCPEALNSFVKHARG